MIFNDPWHAMTSWLSSGGPFWPWWGATTGSPRFDWQSFWVCTKAFHLQIFSIHSLTKGLPERAPLLHKKIHAKSLAIWISHNTCFILGVHIDPASVISDQSCYGLPHASSIYTVFIDVSCICVHYRSYQYYDMILYAYFFALHSIHLYLCIKTTFPIIQPRLGVSSVMWHSRQLWVLPV